jgi:predicted DNA-binding transcriptional regulator AlpA
VRGHALSPRLVARADAAYYVGVGTTLFDDLVRQGMMPRPKAIGSRRLWDLRELDKAIDELPEAGEPPLSCGAPDGWDAVA